MIRQETPTVGLVRGEPALTEVYGFAWCTTAPENTLQEGTAVLRAEVEYADGRRSTFVVRPRAWYGGRQLMTRVWLTSTVGGRVAYLEVATAADVVPPPASPPSSDRGRVDDVLTYVTDGNPLVRDWLNPGWATGFTLMGWNTTANNPAFQISILHPDGSTPNGAVGDWTPSLAGPYPRILAAFGPGSGVGGIGVAGTAVHQGAAPAYGVRTRITCVAGTTVKLLGTWTR